METRIKELRIQKNLTQAGLAMEIGCSQNLISKIEQGKAKPTSDILKSMSKFFNVSIDYLLCETEYKYKADMYVNPQDHRIYEYYVRYNNLSAEKQQLIDKLIIIFSGEPSD